MASGPEEVSDRRVAFSVDTHLFRELGALLVGRDSTALVELIKNAYDADATTVVVHGEQLTNHGTISVNDDGNGMSLEDFTTKFLRIAGRSKESGDRRSPRFKRKYTGAKGIGRLSAHKLGNVLGIESQPLLSNPADGFRARIDWQALETSTASMEDAREIFVEKVSPSSGVPSGTLLTVARLHSEWNSRQLNSFLSEVRSTRPDPALYQSQNVAEVISGALLVPEIPIADATGPDPGFTIELAGEFAGSEPQWPTLLARMNWVLEVDALTRDAVHYRVTPTGLTVATNPHAQQRDFVLHRKAAGPRFAARVFIRGGVGRKGGEPRLPDTLERFSRDAAGIRLFMEGFRVLPYGSARNDWLSLDQRYSRRQSLDLPDGLGVDAPSEIDERTYRLPNANHFGAVFLHDEGAAGLQMVVNREGFLPGEDFDSLTEILQRGLEIATRVRASFGALLAEEVKAADEAATREFVEQVLTLTSENPAGQEPPRSRPPDERELVSALVTAGRQAAKQLRTRGPRLDGGATQDLRTIQAALDSAARVFDRSRDEQSQLRVLASLGTIFGAFVHEVNSLLGQARTVRDLLDALIETTAGDSDVAQLRRVRRAQNELVAGFERQALYLTDSIGAEARKRRVRLDIRAAWESAKRLLGDAASRRGVQLKSDLPAGVRVPPMFPAEINVILSNLLSNAIKAAARDASENSRGIVRIVAGEHARSVWIEMQNTGVRVDLEDSERWFSPFESTTAELDSSLGQGLGLGLTLTRRIVEEYGGTIRFVAPPEGFATAVRLELPKR